MRKRGFIWLIAVMLVVFGVTALLFFWLLPDSPHLYMKEARKEIGLARDARAETYAAPEFMKATNFYDSAHALWSSENSKWILRREYSETIRLAGMAVAAARMAAEKALDNEQSLRVKLDRKIGQLQHEFNDFEKIYGDMPLKKDEMNQLHHGRMKLSEAELAFSNGDLLAASDAMDMAQGHLKFVKESAGRRIRTYFGQLQEWKEMAEVTIRESARDGSSAIIVDKYSQVCHLYIAGRKKADFRIEMGPNWMGDKNFRGDLATPEGVYKVTKKKEGHHTRYYKALLIDYPNTEDERRFRENVKNGKVPPNALIGDLIEIHGEGGKGMHWTRGCISLTNDDMDHLFRYVKEGTKVTIVGSLVEFNENGI